MLNTSNKNDITKNKNISQSIRDSSIIETLKAQALEIQHLKQMIVFQYNQNKKLKDLLNKNNNEDLSFLDSDNESDVDNLNALQSNYNSKKNNKTTNCTSIKTHQHRKIREERLHDEVEQDDINNNLMMRLNSELEVKRGNNKKKKDTILKPFDDKTSNLFDSFDNQLRDFRGI